MSNVCNVNIRRELKKLGLTFNCSIDAELLASILPNRIQIEHDFFLKMNKGNKGWGIWYETNSLGLQVDADGEVREIFKVLSNTFRREYKLSDAMGSYMIMLLDNKLISIDDIQNKITIYSQRD